MAKEPPRTFKDVLRQHRIAADLTQEELAEQAGLSTRAISDLERGVKQHLRKDTAQMLADGLGLVDANREVFLAAARRPVAAGQSVQVPTGSHRREVPAPPSPLIGRVREIADASDLLRRSDVRLLTLTGPGGVGKTSLAMQIGQDVADHFTDGIVFVDLAPLTDPSLLMSTVARALDYRETVGQSLADSLSEYLADQRLLLVLDNFEHLVVAARDIAQLLATTSQLRLLVTSRIALRIRAEHEFPVVPLAVPVPTLRHEPEDLRANPAVTLFVQRAQAINARFDSDSQALTAIGSICQRLDGLPLAIELVAARTRGLSPADLLSRLDLRLDLLTGGPSDLPARQQTMRAAIGWGYDLLEPEEQLLFRRVSACTGGFSLSLAEALGKALGEPADALSMVESLIAKSLLQRDESTDETRFTMLETIREFGREQLAGSGEEDAMRRAHATFFLTLVESASPELAGADQPAWLDQIEREHDNLRSALDWWIASGTDEALRAMSILWWFWWVRGYLAEGRSWLQRALTKSDAAPPSVRAQALIGAGTLAESQGDYEQAIALHEEALTLYRSISDQSGMTRALESLGSIAQDGGDYQGATTYHEEVLRQSTALNDRQGIAHALLNLGTVAAYQGVDERAVALKTEALSLFEDLADERGIAAALTDLATLAFRADDLDEAMALYDEALAHWQALGDKQGMALVMAGLGDTEQRRARFDVAHELFAQALPLYEELGDKRGLANVYTMMAQMERRQGNLAEAVHLLRDSLQLLHVVKDREAIAGNFEELARIASIRGWHEPAARVMGAARALREEVGAPPAAIDQRELEVWATSTRAALGADVYRRAAAAGRDALQHDLWQEPMTLVKRLDRE